MLLCFLSSYAIAQSENGCPLNFPFTETFCFTNNSGTTEHGAVLTSGCTFEVCVKVKPKLSCYPNCNYVSTDGFYSTYCETVTVGSTLCFNVPSTHIPMTDCWDIEISLRIVSHSQTLNANMQDIDIFEGVTYGDDCENLPGDKTNLKRLSSGMGNFNFDIRLRRLAGG